MLVALNHDEPAVADHVVTVMGRWLAAGADGWRLDAAYAVPPAFWARVLPQVRERFPDVNVVGEVIHGEYADIVAASGMDAVTQYELWKAIRSALEERNLFELRPRPRPPQRHAGHVRAADVHRQPRRHPHGQRPRRRAAPAARAGHAVHRGRHSIGVLPRRAGVPRTKEERAGAMTQSARSSPRAPRNSRCSGRASTGCTKEMIGLRRRHPWLHRACTTPVHLTNTALIYEVQADGHRLVTALN